MIYERLAASSARCACPLFSAGAGTLPCRSRPTRRERAEETGSWKGKLGALGMAEPLGTARMPQLPLWSCICSLRAVGFTDAETEIVKGGCSWDLQWLAGSSEILES